MLQAFSTYFQYIHRHALHSFTVSVNNSFERIWLLPFVFGVYNRSNSISEHKLITCLPANNHNLTCNKRRILERLKKKNAQHYFCQEVFSLSGSRRKKGRNSRTLQMIIRTAVLKTQTLKKMPTEVEYFALIFFIARRVVMLWVD